MNSIENKILKVINNNKLSLRKEGERDWFKFRIRITFLHWSRNLFDGYKIEVYDKSSLVHLGTILYPEY